MSDPDAQASAMRPLLERFGEDLALARRCHGIPLCEADLEAQRAFLRGCEATLAGLDFEAMGRADRIDWLLWRSQLAFELRKLSRREERWREAAPLLPFGPAIVALACRRRAVERLEPRAAAEQVTGLAREIDELRTSLEAQVAADDGAAALPRKSLAWRAAKLAEELRESLEECFEFYDGYDPLFTWWVGEPYGKADAALEKYVAFLREELVGLPKAKEDEAEGADEEAPIVGDPVGRQALLDELAHAMVPYTPEELIGIGERELAWCEAELLEASREMGCGDDWRQALERVKRDHVAPGEQPRLIRDLAVEAVAFLDEHDLVTIPPLAREGWRMAMMPPERQKVNPFFTGGETITVSFPTHVMAHGDKLMSLRGNNIHFARATVHHELIPGHHLQGFMARRYRPYRGVFHTPFFLEGWALYWEMLLWDLGFAQTAEQRVGMLFWRLHRAARIVFSLRFHLGEMAAEACVAFLIERVGHEPANARAEVRRSVEASYVPLYQAAYMLGGLQLRALHGELVASGRMTARAFHDALLREGSVPIEMIRASLTGQSLGRGFAPCWRFDGPTA